MWEEGPSDKAIVESLSRDHGFRVGYMSMFVSLSLARERTLRRYFASNSMSRTIAPSPRRSEEVQMEVTRLFWRSKSDILIASHVQQTLGITVSYVFYNVLR